MSQSHTHTAAYLAIAVAVVGVAGVMVVAWISTGSTQVDSLPTSRSPLSKPLTLIVSGDTNGWITPCGCTSNQSGGLLRRGTFVAAKQAAGEVLVADAGGAPAGNSPYEKLKFEAILKGELAMGLAAHNIGAAEARLGADYLRSTARKLDVPFVSANVRDTSGTLLAPAYRITERSAGRIAIVGVLSQSFATPELQVDEPREAILAALGGMPEPYDRLVVLAYLPDAELRSLASSLPEADIVVGGPTGQSIAPTRLGPTLMAAATNKGKFLIEFVLTSAGNAAEWTGQPVELSDAYSDSPEQLANLKDYYGELARAEFVPEQTDFVEMFAAHLPASYHIAGTRSCNKCHQNDCTHWETTKHAHAWESLLAQGAHVDSYCQQCHTTGYGLPGGFASPARTPKQSAVGCESCHGPSKTHVENPQVRTPFLASDQCVRCHDHENSPEFGYAAYWQRIVHGLKTGAAEASTPAYGADREVTP